MRLETGGETGRKFGGLSGHNYPCGNHNRGTEICKVNWKSHPEVTSKDRDRNDPNKLPSSDDRSGKNGTVYVTDTDIGKCKMAVGAESGKTKTSKDADSDRNKTTVVTESKENEADVSIANKVIVTQREKDFSKRQEKQSDLSDDDSSNEDSENECTESKEEMTRKPVLNMNIISDPVSDVESRLKNLEITQSGDGKGELWERSPMVSERQRVRGEPPYPQISSQLRCNGGGIVAESPAPTDCWCGLSPSAIVQNNIIELPEPNNNVLVPSEPEFPFGEESSLPEANNNFLPTPSQGCLYGEDSSPLPQLEQKDLDLLLNDNDGNVDKGNTEHTNDNQLMRYLEELSDFNSPNILPEQNDLGLDAVLSHPCSSSLPYRLTESISSLSPPSSGSQYSSDCSPSSSPVSSLADSVAGKSDSDTENEFLKTEPNLPIGYVTLSDDPSCSAQSVNDRGTSSATRGPPPYPSASDPYMWSQPSHSAISWLSMQRVQSVNIVHSVPPGNPAVNVRSATSMPLAEPVSRSQTALPANCLHITQSPNSFQHPQPSTCFHSVQSNCFQPEQPVIGMQQAQPAVSVQLKRPVPPAISGRPTCQNMPLASSTNTQTVIIPTNIQPFPYMPPQPLNIQQGPVIPETVAVSARERIAAKVDRGVKDLVVMKLAKLSDHQLSRGDEHGDTLLMICIASKHPHKLEKIYVMVSRLKNISGALAARNAQNLSALNLACLFLHDMPLAARFIAEVMLEKGLPVNEVDDKGNTLLHLICSLGDSHVYVLAELLSMKDHNNAPVFDINQHNHRAGTPLHVALKKHSKKVNCSQTVGFLLSQGADVLAQERSLGLTSLHMAIKESCDPLLVQLLLRAAERRNIDLVSKGDYPGDRAIHYVALRNDIALQQQARVFELLVRYGAASNRCGSQGRTPLALVSAERKRDIQKIIHRR